MNIRLRFLPLLAFCVVLTACNEESTSRYPQKTLPKLATYSVSKAEISQEQVFDGVLEAINQSTVSAQTSGRVLEVRVDVGDKVEKGDLIVRLTDTTQKAQVSSAEAQYQEAKAQYTRLQGLYKKRLIAKAELDKAESSFKSAKASLEEAKESLNYTKIYAPYSGIVLNRLIKVGETVASGTALMTGLSLENLRVQVSIPQQSIQLIRQYHQAYVKMPDGHPLSIVDIRIPPSADSQSHSFHVLARLPEGSHGLYPGTLVKIVFIVGKTERLLVPASAVAHRGEVTGVYVIEGNQLAFRMVRLGSLTDQNQYPVLSGLSEEDVIAEDPVAAAAAYKLVNHVSASSEQ